MSTLPKWLDVSLVYWLNYRYIYNSTYGMLCMLLRIAYTTHTLAYVRAASLGSVCGARCWSVYSIYRTGLLLWVWCSFHLDRLLWEAHFFAFTFFRVFSLQQIVSRLLLWCVPSYSLIVISVRNGRTSNENRSECPAKCFMCTSFSFIIKSTTTLTDELIQRSDQTDWV